MIRRAFRRIAWAVLVVWATTTVTFFINNVLPSDPARMVAGPQARPNDVERIRQQLGLDRPVLEQYGRFMRRLVHTGPSHFDSKDKEHGTCASVVARALRSRKELPAAPRGRDDLGREASAHAAPRDRRGARAAAHRRLHRRHRRGEARTRPSIIATVAASLVGISAPTFLIGLALQFVLAHELRLLPLDGFGEDGGRAPRIARLAGAHARDLRRRVLHARSCATR